MSKQSKTVLVALFFIAMIEIPNFFSFLPLNHNLNSNVSLNSNDNADFKTKQVKKIYSYSNNSAIDTQVITGSVINPLNRTLTTSQNPMYYNSSETYPVFLFQNYSYQASRPVNLSLSLKNSPILYGVDFNTYNSSLNVYNTTLFSPGSSGSSIYSFNPSANNKFLFSSWGNGGTVWSNFTVSSFANKNILNPFKANLILNFSCNFLNLDLPTDGLVYTFYMDFKFNINKTAVTSPFPSILRLYLLYSANYANYPLRNINGNPDFKYYFNSNSNINLFLNTASFNSSKSFSINVSQLFSQISFDLNTVSFTPYFNSFKGLELGFFSTNSSAFRTASLSMNHFSFYNSFLPSQWLNVSGIAENNFNKMNINNSLLDGSKTFQNCFKILFQLVFSNKYSLDQQLFTISPFLFFSINVSFFDIINFNFNSFDESNLYWGSNVTLFPIFNMTDDSGPLFPNFVSRYLGWLIDTSWTSFSLPTTNNHQMFFSSPSILDTLAEKFNSMEWYGGTLNANFQYQSFPCVFISSNSFSKFTIQGSFSDNAVNILLFNTVTLRFFPTIDFYQNVSGNLISINSEIIMNENFNNVTISIPFNLITNDSSQFLLIAYPRIKTNGFIIQAFNLQQILTQNVYTFNCGSNITPSSIQIGQSFNFNLTCSFNSNQYPQNFLKTVLIQVLFLNSTQYFQFSNFSTYSDILAFKQSFQIPSNLNLTSNSLYFNYSVINLAAYSNKFLYSNFSILSIFQSLTTQTSFENVYSPWPFYLLFSTFIIGLILFRKKKIKNILSKQMR